MIITKHVTPLRCKILRALGFTSISRMFTRCDIGVKPYKGCAGCENNVLEMCANAFLDGLEKGLAEREVQKGGAE